MRLIANRVTTSGTINNFFFGSPISCDEEKENLIHFQRRYQNATTNDKNDERKNKRKLLE